MNTQKSRKETAGLVVALTMVKMRGCWSLVVRYLVSRSFKEKAFNNYCRHFRYDMSDTTSYPMIRKKIPPVILIRIESKIPRLPTPDLAMRIAFSCSATLYR